MTLFPHRCDYSRLHLEQDTITDCEACKDRKALIEPDPKFYTPSPSAPVKKRGRPRKQVQEEKQTSDSGVDVTDPSSPLQSRSGPVSDQLYHFHPATPEPSQSVSLEDYDQDDNIVVYYSRQTPVPQHQQMSSPTSIQVIPETPLAILQAQQQPPFRRHSSQAPEVLLPNNHTIHRTINADLQIENSNLRVSRNQIVNDLRRANVRTERLRSKIAELEGRGRGGVGDEKEMMAELRGQLAATQKQMKSFEVQLRKVSPPALGLCSHVLRGGLVAMVVVIFVVLVLRDLYSAERVYADKRREVVLFGEGW